MQKYRFLGIGGTTTVPTKRFAYTFPSDRVSDQTSKFWCVHNGIYMYYVTKDNKVWSVYLDANSVEKDVTSVVNPNGHEIVAIETFGSEGHSQGGVLGSEWIYVVTKDPSKSDDECCTLAVYGRVANDIDGTLELKSYTYTNAEGDEVVTPLKWTGLGNTVALSWKDM
jgi:hypothetical protein